MPEYNSISGRDVERIRVLSDGVFAVAMTLLVLDLRLPTVPAKTDVQLWSQLSGLLPQFVAYALSFTLLGTFWLAQHTLLAQLNGSDRHQTWAGLIFLFFVTTLPFTASVLASHVNLRLAVGLYWLNLLMLGVGIGWQILHARRADLFVDPDAYRLIWRRLVLAQILYAVAAAVAFLSPPAAVLALAVVQLFFMISPRLPWAI